MEQLTFEQLPTAVIQLYQKMEHIESLLLQSVNIKSDSDELLTIKQAAEFLSLSVPTIYSLVSKSQIPVNKRGKRLYFSKHEITSWIKEGRRRTISEGVYLAKQHTNKKKI